MNPFKILAIGGTRPNFVKLAPLMRCFKNDPRFDAVLVHTGQHFDDDMFTRFIAQVGMPPPDIDLGIAGGLLTDQLGRMLVKLTPVVQEQRPHCVVVVGDVTSTLAGALVARYLDVPVAHVEAGLRSMDRTMPEENNRVLVDAISDFLFVTEPSGVENLKREGVAEDKIHFVGNVMIDALDACRPMIAESRILTEMKLAPRGYGVVTMHRPANVDSRESLSAFAELLDRIGRTLPLVWPVHPRTRTNLQKFNLLQSADAQRHVRLTAPIPYCDFLRLVSESAVVLTDSGGIQEETTVMGVPCITMRDNTERPVTVSEGTNTLAGTDIIAIYSAFQKVTAPGRSFAPRRPRHWDGRAAPRIADILHQMLA